MNASVIIHWTDVGAVDDVPFQGARRVETDMGPIAIFDSCPHKGGPLSEGIVHGKAVACPLHNWSIGLESGEALGADAGKGCTPVVPLMIEDGRIFLGLRV